MLFEMIQSLSAIVFRNLQTIEHFTANPDLVEEFFYLVARFIGYDCRTPLLSVRFVTRTFDSATPETYTDIASYIQSPPLLSSILQCGVIGLRLEHREAHQGVLHCFEKVIDAGLDAPGTFTPQLAEQRELVRSVILQPTVGSAIVEGILRSLSGELPAYALDENHGSLTGVLWKLYLLSPAQLTEWAAAALGSISVEVASIPEKEGLMRLIASEPPQGPFTDAIMGFSARCRERARSRA